MKREENILLEHFQKETAELIIRRVRIALVVGVILVPLFGLLDKFIAPSHFRFFMALRLGGSLFLAFILFLTYRHIAKKILVIISMAGPLTIGAIFCIMIHNMGAYESTYYAGLILIILTMAGIVPWRLKDATVICGLIYLFYLVALLTSKQAVNLTLLVNNHFFLLSAIFIALIASYDNYKMRFEEFKGRFNLALAHEQLKELDKLKTQFFSNISHEFRTPLTLILAPIESMLKGKSGALPPEVKKNANVVYNNSLRLLKLIDDLLDITKIDAQRMELDLEKGDVGELIKGILASVENVAEKKRLKLYYTQKSKIPQFYFDRDKVEKVLLNLISNALKFTDQGEIEIISEQAGEMAVIKIRDTGIGIADEELPKMFNRFMQVDGGATRRHEGTGIGLALSKELVELHKGNIRIESRAGEGATLVVELPLTLEKGVRLAEGPRAEKRGRDWLKDIHKKAQFVGQGTVVQRANTKETSTPKKHQGDSTVLIVEDNPDMLNFITLQLKDSYDVVTARDGREGLELTKKHLPDLVLADIMMPRMSGYDLLKAIRSDYNLKNIPVIFLTAKAGIDMKLEGLRYGADDYLVKPFNSQELLVRVKNIITNREMRELYIIAKLASVEQLAAEAAHEIKNPLSSIKTFTEFLSERGNDRVFIEEFQKIVSRQVERINTISHNLLNFRPSVPRLKLVNIHRVIDDTLILINNGLDKKKISLNRNYAAQMPSLMADSDKLEQVFLNLFLNSIDAMEERGVLKVETDTDKNSVIVKISDTGKGIPQKDIQRLFEPFYTTKEKGTGLGLSVVYGIIKNHNGSIEVESQLNKGTTFTIKLPLRS